jgi:hypothetical protein
MCPVRNATYVPACTPGLGAYTAPRVKAVNEALAQLEHYADQMCRCADVTCAEHVIKQLPMWAMNKIDPRFTDHWSFDAAQQARARGIAERFTTCMTKAADAAPRGQAR